MHRFFAPSAGAYGQALKLSDREAHHALHVLRLRQGDTVQVLNGQGQIFRCEICHCDKDSVSLTVLETHSAPPPRCQVTLAQAIPKGKLFEEILQKATELGAFQIVPLLTERVVGKIEAEEKARKQEKWRQVTIEAVKQCGAPWLPRVEPPSTLTQFLSLQASIELPLFGSLGPDPRHPRSCFEEFQRNHGRMPRSVSIAIGPEGDFTAREREELQAKGAQPIGLGPLVLRTDTAAAYCLSFINYELQAHQ